ncbi:MAG: hypothetical protein DDT22_00731 [candidate division WS2 bacterium]|nr:hypothetical protein [Candidatus Lithacetigena glycinireducens]
MNKKYIFIIACLSVLIISLAGGIYYFARVSGLPFLPVDKNGQNNTASITGELVIEIPKIESQGKDNQVTYFDVWVDAGISLPSGEVSYLYSQMARRFYHIDKSGGLSSLIAPKLVSMTVTSDKMAFAGEDKSIGIISREGEPLYYEFMDGNPKSVVFQDDDVLLASIELTDKSGVIHKISSSQAKILETLKYAETPFKLYKHSDGNIYYLSSTGVYTLDNKTVFKVKNAIDFLMLDSKHTLAVTVPAENRVILNRNDNQSLEIKGIFLSFYKHPRPDHFLVSAYHSTPDHKDILSLYLIKSGEKMETVWSYQTTTNVLRGETVAVMRNGEIVISTRGEKDKETGNFIWNLKAFQITQDSRVESIGTYSLKTIPVLSLFQWGDLLGVGTTRGKALRLSIKSFE